MRSLIHVINILLLFTVSKVQTGRMFKQIDYNVNHALTSFTQVWQIHIGDFKPLFLCYVLQHLTSVEVASAQGFSLEQIPPVIPTYRIKSDDFI